MDRVVITVARSTYMILRALADEEGSTVTEIVDRAVRDYQGLSFWSDYYATSGDGR